MQNDFTVMCDCSLGCALFFLDCLSPFSFFCLPHDTFSNHYLYTKKFTVPGNNSKPGCSLKCAHHHVILAKASVVTTMYARQVCKYMFQ